MSALTLLSFALAAITAAALAALYLAWPREATAEEFVLRHRRVRQYSTTALARQFPGGGARVSRRLGWALRLLRADLRLLHLRGQIAQPSEEALAMELFQLWVLGTAIGLLLGLALWLLAGRPGLPGYALLLAAAMGGLPPGLRWLGLRRDASQVRESIRHHLPRILTGARVLLESGALTPKTALSTAVAVYQDAAATALREALVRSEAHLTRLDQALEEVGEAYGLEELRRLGDAYRVGTAHGTQMADLLTEYAVRLRHLEQSGFRERMTRAPVLMAVPALVFFLMPLMAVMLLLVLFPLASFFKQV